MFRNSRGFVQGCFSYHIGQVFAYEVEIHGVIVVVDFAWSFSWRSLWIEANSIYVIDLIEKKSTRVPCNLRRDWSICLYRLSQMEYGVSHILKDNQVIGKLVAHAIQSAQNCWWHHFLDFFLFLWRVEI